jgi:hypothetical protein
MLPRLFVPLSKSPKVVTENGTQINVMEIPVKTMGNTNSRIPICRLIPPSRTIERVIITKLATMRLRPLMMPMSRPASSAATKAPAAAGAQRQPRIRRGIAKQILHEERQDGCGAVEQRSQQRDQADTDRKIPIQENAQIHQRMWSREFAGEEGRKRQRGDRHVPADRGRAELIEFLSAKNAKPM